MSKKPVSYTENVKNAAALAQMISNHIGGSNTLSLQWELYAQPAQRENLVAAEEDVAVESLSAAAENSPKEKRESLTKLYNAMIRRTEIVVDVLVKADPALEQGIIKLFSDVKSTPKYAGLDLVGAYEAMGAPVLAKAARKALFSAKSA